MRCRNKLMVGLGGVQQRAGDKEIDPRVWGDVLRNDYPIVWEFGNVEVGDGWLGEIEV